MGANPFYVRLALAFGATEVLFLGSRTGLVGGKRGEVSSMISNS